MVVDGLLLHERGKLLLLDLLLLHGLLVGRHEHLHHLREHVDVH
jgi:hypothetical protein